MTEDLEDLVVVLVEILAIGREEQEILQQFPHHKVIMAELQMIPDLNMQVVVVVDGLVLAPQQILEQEVQVEME